MKRILLSCDSLDLLQALMACDLPAGFEFVSLPTDSLKPADPGSIFAAVENGQRGEPWAAVVHAPGKLQGNRKGDYAISWLLGATAPACFGEACARAKVPLVYLSTENIDLGNNDTGDLTPFFIRENVRAAGELAVQGSGAHHAIVRASWVMSVDPKNLVVKLVKYLCKLKSGKVPLGDFIGDPVSVKDLAQCGIDAAVLMALENKTSLGVVTCTSCEQVNWYDFVNETLSILNQKLFCNLKINIFRTADRKNGGGSLSASIIDHRYGVGAFERASQPWRGALSQVICEMKPPL